MQFIIDYYSKITQKQREGKLHFNIKFPLELLIAKNYDVDYPEIVKNVTAKALVQSFVELNDYQLGHYQLRDIITENRSNKLIIAQTSKTIGVVSKMAKREKSFKAQSHSGDRLGILKESESSGDFINNEAEKK